MVRVIENIEELSSIKKDCNRLADKIQMPLMRFEWLVNCAKTVSSNEKLFVIVLFSGENVKAIAPMVLVKKYFSERLEMLGASLHSEPMSFLYEDEDSLLGLLQAINNMKKTIFLYGLNSSSLEMIKLEQLHNHQRSLNFVRSGNIPYLPITDTWENFQQNVSSSRRSSLRRLKKLAENNGNVSIEIKCPPAETVDKYLDEIFELEASGWKKQIGTAMMVNKKLGAFFRNYSREAADLKILQLCFLRIDGTAVAAQIGLEYANRFWILKIGHNEKYAKFSPGILLMNEVIRYSFGKKLDAIEFLGGNEQWLHIWTDHLHDMISYRIYHSYVSCFFDFTNAFANVLLKRVRPFLYIKWNSIGNVPNA
ncbi:MAG: GNAT family N-acetyltransferase [Ignavibacteriae bacterium]|nr:GNAT family N-acetyltransferase [Ignavibacteriota bacterium]